MEHSRTSQLLAGKLLEHFASGAATCARSLRPVLDSTTSTELAAAAAELSKHDYSQQLLEVYGVLRALSPLDPLYGLCDEHTYEAIVTLVPSSARGVAFALKLLEETNERGVQRTVSLYASIMSLCVRAGSLQVALTMYNAMVNDGIEPNLMAYHILMDVYGQTQHWDKALDVLAKLQDRGSAIAWTYSVAVTACARSNRAVEALRVIDQMLSAGFTPCLTTYTSFISLFCRAGALQEACVVFEAMKAAGVAPNTITYSSLINGCEKAGNLDAAMLYFHEMLTASCVPSTVTYNTLLRACSLERKWDLASSIWTKMADDGVKPDVVSMRAWLTVMHESGCWPAVPLVLQQQLPRVVLKDRILRSKICEMLWSAGAVSSRKAAVDASLSRVNMSKVDFAAYPGDAICRGPIVTATWHVSVMQPGPAIIALESWLSSLLTKYDWDGHAIAVAAALQGVACDGAPSATSNGTARARSLAMSASAHSLPHLAASAEPPRPSASLRRRVQGRRAAAQTWHDGVALTPWLGAPHHGVRPYAHDRPASCPVAALQTRLTSSLGSSGSNSSTAVTPVHAFAAPACGDAPWHTLEATVHRRLSLRLDVSQQPSLVGAIADAVLDAGAGLGLRLGVEVDGSTVIAEGEERELTHWLLSPAAAGLTSASGASGTRAASGGSSGSSGGHAPQELLALHAAQAMRHWKQQLAAVGSVQQAEADLYPRTTAGRRGKLLAAVLQHALTLSSQLQLSDDALSRALQIATFSLSSPSWLHDVTGDGLLESDAPHDEAARQGVTGSGKGEGGDVSAPASAIMQDSVRAVPGLERDLALLRAATGRGRGEGLHWQGEERGLAVDTSHTSSELALQDSPGAAPGFPASAGSGVLSNAIGAVDAKDGIPSVVTDAISRGLPALRTRHARGRNGSAHGTPRTRPDHESSAQDGGATCSVQPLYVAPTSEVPDKYVAPFRGHAAPSSSSVSDGWNGAPATRVVPRGLSPPGHSTLSVVSVPETAPTPHISHASVQHEPAVVASVTTQTSDGVDTLLSSFQAKLGLESSSVASAVAATRHQGKTDAVRRVPNGAASLPEPGDPTFAPLVHKICSSCCLAAMDPAVGPLSDSAWAATVIGAGCTLPLEPLPKSLTSTADQCLTLYLSIVFQQSTPALSCMLDFARAHLHALSAMPTFACMRPSLLAAAVFVAASQAAMRQPEWPQTLAGVTGYALVASRIAAAPGNSSNSSTELHEACVALHAALSLPPFRPSSYQRLVAAGPDGMLHMRPKKAGTFVLESRVTSEEIYRVLKKAVKARTAER